MRMLNETETNPVDPFDLNLSFSLDSPAPTTGSVRFQNKDVGF